MRARVSALFALLLASATVGCSSGSGTSPDAGAGGAHDLAVAAVDDLAAPAGADLAHSASADLAHPASLDLALPANADLALPSVAVGVTTRTFVDNTRPTPVNGTAAAQPNRTLVTEIWYPTAGAVNATVATRDAPLLAGGPYPLVLFVHGSSSSRTVYSYLTIGLASAGYVVAAADFPLTSLATPGGASDLHVTDEVGDLSFLADQLKAASVDAADALHAAVDGLHYAVVGHSTGGAVAELAAFAPNDAAITHDARVSAIVPLSGDACMFNAQFFKSRSVPTFVIGASDDLFVPVADNGQWLFDNTNAPHLMAKLIGAQHVYYTDFPLPDALAGPVPTGPTSPLATTLAAYGDASECLPVPAASNDPAMDFGVEHTYVLQLVTAYLDAQLRQSPAPLDALLAAHDPLVVFQQ
jgi:predicted dienelactone hydrolase